MFLYHLIFMAHLQLETLFSDEKLLFQKDHRHFEQLLLLLRLEGKCSLRSIAAIVKALEYHPHSVGYLSQCFRSYGQALPSTLSMPSQKFVFSLSDEIFAMHAPIVVPIEARNTTILKIQLASDRSADTWKAHCEALEDQNGKLQDEHQNNRVPPSEREQRSVLWHRHRLLPQGY